MFKPYVSKLNIHLICSNSSHHPFSFSFSCQTLEVPFHKSTLFCRSFSLLAKTVISSANLNRLISSPPTFISLKSSSLQRLITCLIFILHSSGNKAQPCLTPFVIQASILEAFMLSSVELIFYSVIRLDVFKHVEKFRPGCVIKGLLYMYKTVLQLYNLFSNHLIHGLINIQHDILYTLIFFDNNIIACIKSSGN